MRKHFNDYIASFLLLNKLVKNFGFLLGIKNFIFWKSKCPKKLIGNSFSNPIYLRGSESTDAEVLKHVILNKEYKIPFTVTPNIIVDAGANIGLATIFFKKEYPNAIIFSIEPEEENFIYLEKNLSIYNDCILLKKALWFEKDTLTISDKLNLGNWGFITGKNENLTANGQVETITMEELMKIYNLEKIDLMKIDIESAEKKLFSANYHSWLPKVNMIIIELHDRFEKGCSKTFFSAINNCWDDYSLFQLGEDNLLLKNESNF